MLLVGDSMKDSLRETSHLLSRQRTSVLPCPQAASSTSVWTWSRRPRTKQLSFQAADLNFEIGEMSYALEQHFTLLGSTSFLPLPRLWLLHLGWPSWRKRPLIRTDLNTVSSMRSGKCWSTGWKHRRKKDPNDLQLRGAL